jgi:type IV secretory pathway ATPase VirB11/archaellum biosynthesis ATPase
MLGTIEDAVQRVLNCWVDLPPPMKKAIEQFRTQLGGAIDSRRICRKHSTEKYTKLSCGWISSSATA